MKLALIFIMVIGMLTAFGAGIGVFHLLTPGLSDKVAGLIGSIVIIVVLMGWVLCGIFIRKRRK